MTLIENDLPALVGHKIANVFPLLDPVGPEMKLLVDDIRANGLNHRILLFEGRILDGRNRYRACRLGEIPMTTTDFEEFVGTWDEAISFVASENLVRRHLSVNQRVVAATRLSRLRRGTNQYEEKVDAHMCASTSDEQEPVVTQADAAKMMKVSRRSVQEFRAVEEKGVEELVAAVEADVVSVRAAETLTELPPEEQKKVVAEGPAAVKKAASKIRKDKVAKQALSPVQKAARSKATFDNTFSDLMKSVTNVKKLVGQLAAGDLPMTDDQRSLGVELGDQFITIGEWIKTVFQAGDKGGVASDAAIATFLDGEGQ